MSADLSSASVCSSPGMDTTPMAATGSVSGVSDADTSPLAPSTSEASSSCAATGQAEHHADAPAPAESCISGRRLTEWFSEIRSALMKDADAANGAGGTGAAAGDVSEDGVLRPVTAGLGGAATAPLAKTVAVDVLDPVAIHPSAMQRTMSHTTFSGPGLDGIAIGGWIAFTRKSHIAPADVLDKLEEDLHTSMPDMVFAGNVLQLYHAPSGVSLHWDARGAMSMRRRIKPEDNMKVPFSAHWNTHAKAEAKMLEDDSDWTFTTDYRGQVGSFRTIPNDGEQFADIPAGAEEDTSRDVSFQPTRSRIDLAALRRRDPILWYDELPLFEDELDDCGAARCVVRVRVMPSRWYVLSRFWLRVDGEHLRVIDTRVCHVFGSHTVLRQFSIKEASMSTLPKMEPAQTNDPNVFEQFLPLVKEELEELRL